MQEIPTTSRRIGLTEVS